MAGPDAQDAADLPGRARALAAALPDVAGFADDALRVHRGGAALDAAAWTAELRRRAAAAGGAPFEVTELLQRRNLVFLGWRWGAAAGTWILSFDRDGRVQEWREA